MIVKLISVFVKRGRVDDFMASQEVWNRETSLCVGYLGTLVGRDVGDEDVVHVQVFWRTMAGYERFMREEHDRIAELAGADALYERIEVRVVERVAGDCEVVGSRSL